MRVDIEDGKYTYVFHEDGRSEALRYGEPWRDTVGDKFIYCMAAEIVDLREEVGRLYFLSQYPPLYEELRAVIDGGSESMDHEQAVQEVKDLQAANESLKFERDLWKEKCARGIETIQKLEAERDDADRRAGAAERMACRRVEEGRARESWLRKAKEQWGVDQNVSFDVCWSQALLIRDCLKHLVDDAKLTSSQYELCRQALRGE